jgi:hypothetical protein
VASTPIARHRAPELSMRQDTRSADSCEACSKDVIGVLVARHSQAEALEQLVSRVALITGHPVQLVAAAAGSAVGLPSKPSACEAAEATQVQLYNAGGLLAAVASCAMQSHLGQQAKVVLISIKYVKYSEAKASELAAHDKLCWQVVF